MKPWCAGGRRRILCRIAGFVFAAAGFSSVAYGGKLEAFEEDATKNRQKAVEVEPEEPKTGHGHSYHQGEVTDPTDSLVDACLQLGGTFMGHGGVSSWERVRGTSASPSTAPGCPRLLGEALIPFARVDAGYQAVESDVWAWDVRAEVGFGPIGVQARRTRYAEDQPDDTLTIDQVHFLYRMSFGCTFEADLGLGVFSLEGNETHTAFSLTTPLSYHPTRSFGVEFRPTWTHINGNTIRDYDANILAGWNFVSLRIGYRWLRSETESLDGPQIGLSVRF